MSLPCGGQQQEDLYGAGSRMVTDSCCRLEPEACVLVAVALHPAIMM